MNQKIEDEKEISNYVMKDKRQNMSCDQNRNYSQFGSVAQEKSSDGGSGLKPYPSIHINYVIKKQIDYLVTNLNSRHVNCKFTSLTE